MINGLIGFILGILFSAIMLVLWCIVQKEDNRDE